MLLSAYAVLFPILLPLGTGTFDYAEVLRSPGWVSLAMVAFAGVLVLLVGFYAAYAKIRATAGWQGAVGFLFVEAAYLLQACKVTWELFLYPVVARYPETAFLLRDAVIKNDPAVMAFRISASATILVGIVLFCLSLFGCLSQTLGGVDLRWCSGLCAGSCDFGVRVDRRDFHFCHGLHAARGSLVTLTTDG